MHYFEFPTQDTTLYEKSQSRNAGLDEILEVRKDMNDDGSVINVSRALIKFDTSYISKSIASGLISNPTFYLNLYNEILFLQEYFFQKQHILQFCQKHDSNTSSILHCLIFEVVLFLFFFFFSILV